MSLEYIQSIQRKVDVNETIKLLRSALVAEFLSAHNYWTQAKIIQGVDSEEIRKELIEHRNEEMHHADLLMARIMELGGNPEVRPLDWDNHTKCRYQLAPNWDQKSILEMALSGEKCAIAHYTKMAEFLKNRDTTSYDLIMNILEDEYEHVRDLAQLQETTTTQRVSKHKPKEKK